MNSSSQFIPGTNVNSKNNSSMNLGKLNKKKSNTMSDQLLNSSNPKQQPSARKQQSQFFTAQLSQQFNFVSKIFSTLFPTQHLTFNQFIYCLKSIGLQIQTERKFMQIKSIFDELKVKNQQVIEYEHGVKVGVKLLRQERSRVGSELAHMERGYFHMVVEGNRMEIPYSQQINSLAELKSYINNTIANSSSSPYQSEDINNKKYLTQQSLYNIVKYLDMEQQLSCQQIGNIMKYADQQDKKYLTFQDVITAIQSSIILSNSL